MQCNEGSTTKSHQRTFQRGSLMGDCLKVLSDAFFNQT